jgi:hypothetical protein
MMLMGNQQQKSVSTMSVILRAIVSSLLVFEPDAFDDDLILLCMYAYAKKMKIKTTKLRAWVTATEYCQPGGVSRVM